MNIVIDGYNVIKRNPELSSKEKISMESAREGLIKLMKVYKGIKPNHNVIIVFDGMKEMAGQSIGERSGVKVVFANGSADDYIKSMIEDSPTPADYIVVSDDNDIINHARNKGAGFLNTPRLFEKIGPKNPKGIDNDKPILHSHEERSITQELMNLWLNKDKNARNT